MNIVVALVHSLVELIINTYIVHHSCPIDAAVGADGKFYCGASVHSMPLLPLMASFEVVSFVRLMPPFLALLPLKVSQRSYCSGCSICPIDALLPLMRTFNIVVALVNSMSLVPLVVSLLWLQWVHSKALLVFVPMLVYSYCKLVYNCCSGISK